MTQIRTLTRIVWFDEGNNQEQEGFSHQTSGWEKNLLHIGISQVQQANQNKSVFLDISTVKGNVLSSDDQSNIVINQDGMNAVFDRQIKTHDGWVFGVDLFPIEAKSIEYATSNVVSVMMTEVGIKTEIIQGRPLNCFMTRVL